LIYNEDEGLINAVMSIIFCLGGLKRERKEIT